MLDHQKNTKEHLKMHGNMTSEEKKLNKEDLTAWKVYDNNQYSMIPGVSSSKRFMDRSRIPLKANNTAVYSNYPSRYAYDPHFEVKQERLKQYGLTRDIRDIYKSVDNYQNIPVVNQQQQNYSNSNINNVMINANSPTQRA